MKLFAFLSLLGVAVAQTKPPALLEEALKRLPGVSILDPYFPNPEGQTVDGLKEMGYWPHWRSTDLDRDGRPDAVAVVTRKQGAKVEFGVLAVHAQSPAKVHWIVPLGSESIQGIGTELPPYAVSPLFCIGCDANVYYRWSGQVYEASLRLPGELIQVFQDEDAPTVALLTAPSRGSSVGGRAATCAEAKVLETRGTSYETRWYLVETSGPRPLRGWMPASLVAGDGCLGR